MMRGSISSPSDSILKLDWAESKLIALQSSIKNFARSNKPFFRAEQNPQLNEGTLWAKQSGSCPPEFGLLAGDIANNARCALDYLVYKASKLVPGSPARRKLKFPITNDCSWWNPSNTRIVLNDVDPMLVDVVESFQPYNGLGADDPLFLLHEINNSDKHHTLRTTMAIIRHQSFGLTKPSLAARGFNLVSAVPGARLSIDGHSVEFLGTGEIGEQETPVIRFRGAPGRPFDLEFNAQLTTEIRFGHGQGLIDGRELVQTFRNIIDRVNEVVGKFA